MIENAFYYSNPPETKAVTQEQLPPMHIYIRKLLYKDLNKATVEKVFFSVHCLSFCYFTHIFRFFGKCAS
jgi:regulator of nonsense transcripts 2